MFTFNLLLLATLVSAIPPAPIVRVHETKASLPVVRRLNISDSTIPEIDRARAAHLIATGKSRASGGQPAQRRSFSFEITNEAVTYVASVGVGSPATTYSLIIDTGSSNTWIGAGKPYAHTSTSHFTGQVVTVTYGSGAFIGTEFTDTVTLAKNLVIKNQSIGVALLSEGFQGVDGILGVGLAALTEGTVLPSAATVPTVTDNLANQGTISEKVLGVFFAPTTSESDTNGELTFGGIDLLKTTQSVVFTPITSSSPANEFFGIDQSITYGSDATNVLSSTAGIVDTGTTLVLLETAAFNTYTSLTGATEDPTTGLLTISNENYAKLESLFFHVGGTKFEFTKNAQTWPRALNSAIGGSSDAILLVISDLGLIGAEGLNFINGMTFLERFYSVFDSTNNRVGLATTQHTFDTTN